MGLFEGNYKRNVLTEIERRMRDLEEAKNPLPLKIEEMQTILEFAETARLLKIAEVQLMEKRLQKLINERNYQTFVKENAEFRVDGFTTPLEMARKFRGLEMDAEIAQRKRAEESVQKTHTGEVAKPSSKTNTDGTSERTK